MFGLGQGLRIDYRVALAVRVKHLVYVCVRQLLTPFTIL